MAEKHEAQSEQAAGAQAPQPPPAASANEAIPNGAQGSAAGNRPGRNRSGNPLSLAGEMNLNERITLALSAVSLLVAIGALAVAYLTYRVMSDSRDIKTAIGNLSALAVQTKRQADAQQAQLGLLGQQVGEARNQTKAISEQTTAIKSSSIAAVKTATAEIQSANAETTAATLTANAQRPVISARDVRFSGLNGTPDHDGFVTLTLDFEFANVGGTSFQQKSSLVVISIGSSLPEIPSFTNASTWGTNDFVVGPQSGFHILKPLKFTLSKEQVDDVHNGRQRLYFWGKVNYQDIGNTIHTFCFAFATSIDDPKSDQTTEFEPVGGPAYHCQT